MLFFYVCSICTCLVLSVSSSSLYLGRATACDCGTPWTFLLTSLECQALFSLKKTNKEKTRTNIWLVFYNLHGMFTLWANSADDKFMIFFLFFPENRICYFLQIVSCKIVSCLSWNCLYICLHWRQFAWNVKTCFLGKLRKIFQYVFCWNFYSEHKTLKLILHMSQKEKGICGSNENRKY